MESIKLKPMEKRLPHYTLSILQARIAEQGLMVFTATALFNAAAMGLSEEQILLVLASLTRGMFYKSMTTHADSTVWQDVYHAPTPNNKVAYIKLTLQQGVVVIQFKEK
jgi:motility quorum-sensing regulator/GCU-specific mRNA interferase toxin